MLKVLGLVTAVLMMLVLGSGAPNTAQAIFHNHLENLGDSITDIFKSNQDPVYPYPKSDEQRIINDLYSNHPKITQKDIDKAHYELSDPCIQSVQNPNDQAAFQGCESASNVFLTTYLIDWGYNLMADAPINRAPQLYLPI